MANQQDDSASQFRIGAVSRITQIPIDTLRAWERRYAVVEPARTASAARLYSQDDISRLKGIKRLVDAGHAISSVASCTLAELDELLALHDETEHPPTMKDANVESLLVYRDPEAHIVALESARASGISVDGDFKDWGEFRDKTLTAQPDAVILQLATVLSEDVLRVGRLAGQLKSTRVIVTYGFASQADIERLDRDHIIALRAPVSGEEIVRLLNTATSESRQDDYTPTARPRRLFDDNALEDLAKVSSTVQCECPHHLVDIVKTLNQFERYSAECESRNDEDAALHAQLSITTAISRSLFEKALLEVAEYEGIELPDGIRTVSES